VKWAIEKHNGAPHHLKWNAQASGLSELRESASDIINSWRMPRKVYHKPSWSWEQIELTIKDLYSNKELNSTQRKALEEAIKFQKLYERQYNIKY
ncbi:MAG: hypothetical protein HYU63_04975, partial [Armatimonadetes bacterium]|nr:hypothetical protein [Armatimonadota bacterium]